jgi:hypothetical protein
MKNFSTIVSQESQGGIQLNYRDMRDSHHSGGDGILDAGAREGVPTMIKKIRIFG